MVQNENFKNNDVLAVFIDLQKAFDTINLDILVQKLYFYSIRGVELNWFRTYLLDRKQRTNVNDTLSKLLACKCGVP